MNLYQHLVGMGERRLVEYLAKTLAALGKPADALAGAALAVDGWLASEHLKAHRALSRTWDLLEDADR